MPWLLTYAGSPYRGWHNALDAVLKGNQQLLGDVTHAAHKANIFFIKKLKHPWHNMIIAKNPSSKNKNFPWFWGKKIDDKGYLVMRIQKSSSDISCLFFSSFILFNSRKGRKKRTGNAWIYPITLWMKIATTCTMDTYGHEVWKIIFYPLLCVQSFGFSRVKSSLYYGLHCLRA